GLTSWGEGGRRSVGTAKSVAISLAGPLVGIVIGLGARFYRDAASATLGDRAYLLLGDVIFVNLWWGVLNLLPVLPLDGGNVLMAIAQKVTNGRGARPARTISLAIAGVIAVYALVNKNTFGALLAGLFAVQNYQALRAT